MSTHSKILYVVHCVDTEGPLIETLDATFDRLRAIFNVNIDATRENLSRLQNQEINFGGREEAIAKCFSSALLKYNNNWTELGEMLDVLLSPDFRKKYIDDFEGGWVYSWHCMDHVGYIDNPRHKDIGYGNIYNYYLSKLKETKSIKDEINWHFHPLSLTRNPLHAATSYVNSYDVLTQILCRRIIDNSWFPVVNRPGFHAERPDSHGFLEQWVPFDYANQACDEREDQPDLSGGRFGDWSRAPKSWRGYNPSHDDYQEVGNCRRLIFRCLNIGTRLRQLTQEHVREAFSEARSGGAAILSFADHDYRDMIRDVNFVRNMLNEIKVEFPDVKIRYAGAQEAAIALMGYEKKTKPKLKLDLIENRLNVIVAEGEIFGPQPFLAIKTREGNYYHDNFDVDEVHKKWSYIFDGQTINIANIQKIGVGVAGRFGWSSVVNLSL